MSLSPQQLRARHVHLLGIKHEALPWQVSLHSLRHGVQREGYLRHLRGALDSLGKNEHYGGALNCLPAPWTPLPQSLVALSGLLSLIWHSVLLATIITTALGIRNYATILEFYAKSQTRRRRPDEGIDQIHSPRLT